LDSRRFAGDYRDGASYALRRIVCKTWEPKIALRALSVVGDCASRVVGRQLSVDSSDRFCWRQIVTADL
jgi:hypothetical protein